MRGNNSVTAFAVASFAFSLAGCATQQTVTNPKTITLKDALVDTVNAIDAAHQQAKSNRQFYGFYGCSVTAVFAVSASQTYSNTLSITAAGPPATVLPVSIGGSASATNTDVGARSNTVTVVFDTPYCFPNAKGSSAGKPPQVFYKAKSEAQSKAADGQHGGVKIFKQDQLDR